MGDKRDITGMMRLKIYRFIRQWKADHDGISPTTYEIEDAMNVSRTTVRYHIKRLEILNLITRYGGQGARNIMITSGYLNTDPQQVAKYEQIIIDSERASE